jgi:hypothetical protein
MLIWNPYTAIAIQQSARLILCEGYMPAKRNVGGAASEGLVPWASLFDAVV